MPTLAEVRRVGEARLRAAGFEPAALEARWLLEAVTGLSPSALRLREGEQAGPDQLLLFENIINRRLAHEPLARITGWREFWGLRFHLSAETLEPRPDSETLITTALQYLSDAEAPYRLLDMGTGTGCLLAALLYELPAAHGIALDRSLGALATARRNLKQLQLDHRAAFVQGDWGAALAGQFDLIISNPPYIRTDEAQSLAPEVIGHDPYNALFAGADGLAAYRTLIPHAYANLKPDGVLVLELGIGQGQAVRALAEAIGFNYLATVADLGDIPRAMALKKGLD